MAYEVLYTLPSWLLFIIIIGSSVALAWVGTLLMRRWMKALVGGKQNEVAGFIFATVSVVYAALLAFLIVSVWEQFNAADLAVSEEAASLVTVDRYSATFPEPERREVHDWLRQYTELVINKEWDAMRLNHGEDAHTMASLTDLNKIWTTYRQLSPNVVDSEAMRNLNELSRRRILRIESSTGGLPDIFWPVLVLGAVIVVNFGTLFYLENANLHIFMVLLMAFLNAMCLWIIVALNNPFAGDLQVSSAAFKYALQVLDSLPR